MAYTKTITDANTYYAVTSHVRSFDWANYGTDERTGALAQAKREIELFIGRDVCDPSGTDKFRDDYAIFEQALFILDETVRTTTSQNSAQMIETAETEKRERDYGVTLSPMAQKYLARQRLRISRGS
jgi:hypothetical protein